MPSANGATLGSRTLSDRRVGGPPLWSTSSSAASLSDYGGASSDGRSATPASSSSSSLLTPHEADGDGSGDDFDFGEDLRGGGSISFDGLLSSLAEAGHTASASSSLPRSHGLVTPTPNGVRRFPTAPASRTLAQTSATPVRARSPSHSRPTADVDPDTSGSSLRPPLAPRSTAPTPQPEPPENIVAYVASLRKRPDAARPLQRTQSDTAANALASRPPGSRPLDPTSLHRNALAARRSPQHNRNTSTESTGSVQSADDEADDRLEMLVRPMLAPSGSRSRGGSREATGLETMDLSHRRMGEFPVEVVRMLSGTVERFVAGSWSDLIVQTGHFLQLPQHASDRVLPARLDTALPQHPRQRPERVSRSGA